MTLGVVSRRNLFQWGRFYNKIMAKIYCVKHVNCRVHILSFESHQFIGETLFLLHMLMYTYGSVLVGDFSQLFLWCTAYYILLWVLLLVLKCMNSCGLALCSVDSWVGYLHRHIILVFGFLTPVSILMFQSSYFLPVEPLSRAQESA